MDLRKRILSFAELGDLLHGLTKKGIPELAFSKNNWFTVSETTRALESWSSLLTLDKLTRWTDQYMISPGQPLRNILVITAGNIPLVGFHDFLSVVISGNRFLGKLSSRDDVLLSVIVKELIGIEPEFSGQIRMDDHAISPDAVIATGNDNTSGYFRTEYGHIPNIIRKNRTSAAILDGSESDSDLEHLAADILEYYGLGCRNVSHLYLPYGYGIGNLTGPLSRFDQVDSCVNLDDNLRYQRARLGSTGIKYADAGNALLVENEALHSPVGLVHYSYYKDRQALHGYLRANSAKIQCLIGKKQEFSPVIPFGSAQKPELWDYADNTDTLNFLLHL